MEKKWHIMQPDAAVVKKLSEHLHCHPVTAIVLVNRNLTTAQQVSNFMTASLSNIRPLSAIKDMQKAVKRIYRAIIENEKILIFGDYDADGITAAAVLLNFLRAIGARVSDYIPHRIAEGYSLQVQHIREQALPNGIRLIITADCGSGSHDAVVFAREAGIDVIVTDHHSISENIPPAAAVLNPKRHDCPAGMEMLAGVGVAFALIICLRKYLRERHFWGQHPEPNLKNLCDLVALGTIGDMVPLVAENRIFTKTGLNLIRSGLRPGISALREAAGIADQMLDAEDVAFRLVPRLNAAGRMDHASMALKLLTADDITAARQLAQSLNGLNDRRQEQEKAVLKDILSDFQHHPERLEKKTLVCWDSSWHQGVIGIVASRITETYFRPVVLIVMKGDLGKGSARSIPGLDLFSALQSCQHCLQDFGGHSMAAGLTIRAEKLREFQAAFEKAVTQMTCPEDWMPGLSIDAEIELADITENLVDEIEKLGPFGTGNPEPLLAARNVRVVSSKMVGRNHRKMVLVQDANPGAKPAFAIRFNAEGPMQAQTSFARIAFRLRWNRWNNKRTIQLIVEDAV